MSLWTKKVLKTLHFRNRKQEYLFIWIWELKLIQFLRCPADQLTRNTYNLVNFEPLWISFTFLEPRNMFENLLYSGKKSGSERRGASEFYLNQPRPDVLLLLWELEKNSELHCTVCQPLLTLSECFRVDIVRSWPQSNVLANWGQFHQPNGAKRKCACKHSLLPFSFNNKPMTNVVSTTLN